MNVQAIYPRLDIIEHEIKNLKLLFLQHQETKKVVSLRGMLSGLKITEEDFEDAKKSLFKI